MVANSFSQTKVKLKFFLILWEEENKSENLKNYKEKSNQIEFYSFEPKPSIR